MNIAVIGGGIFGVTTAIKLGESVESAHVTLFEKERDILNAASGINQWRLHRGYHYPRSESTARNCRESAAEFMAEYPGPVITDNEHYYAVAREETKTTPEEYVDHCERVGLEYSEASPGVVRDDGVDLCLRVKENHIDPIQLNATCWRRLREAGVDVQLRTEVESISALEGYDYVVVATYANSNQLLEGAPSLRRECKYQVIEKPVVELPSQFDNRSVVVMDGPFMSFDPYGHTSKFQLDHVVHGVRNSNVGMEPDLDGLDPSLLNGRVVRDPPDSNFEEFVEHGTTFFDGIDEATHVGSRFTVRTVLPDVEDTDERPTIVDRSGNVFMVFSGKIATCVRAADQIVTAIRSD